MLRSFGNFISKNFCQRFYESHLKTTTVDNFTSVIECFFAVIPASIEDEAIVIDYNDHSYICQYCDQQIGSKDKLLEHLSNVHSQSGDIPTVDLLEDSNDSNNECFDVPAQVASKCMYRYVYYQF